MLRPSGTSDSALESAQPERRPARPTPLVDEGLRAGAKLAQARAMLGLSLDEIAARTRVRRDYLEALEAMNVKLLPGRAYTLAYLKSYAAALGLEPKPIIDQFLAESALAREDALPQLRNPESKPRRERPWLAAAAIAAVAAGFVGWQAWSGHQDPRLRTADSAAAAPLQVALEAAGPTPTAAPAQVVELRALTQAWLEVRGPDGTIFLSRDLQPGDRYRPDVGAGWTVHARDGGAFEVSIDGRPIGLLGEAGAPVLGRHVDSLAEGAAPPSTTPQG
jgi:transcriptional regulator with XRE-family HTH domain